MYMKENDTTLAGRLKEFHVLVYEVPSRLNSTCSSFGSSFGILVIVVFVSVTIIPLTLGFFFPINVFIEVID